MSSNKTTLYTTKISRDFVTTGFTMEDLQGRHRVGVVYATFNKDGNMLYESNAEQLTQEVADAMVASGEMKVIYKNAHTQESGLYEFKMYYIEYFNTKSSIFKPTRTDIQYDGPLTVEIVVSLNDDGEDWTRIYYYEYKTFGHSPLTLKDLELEEIFEDMFTEKEQGLGEDEAGYDYGIIYDCMGIPERLDVSPSELAAHVVSVRLI